MLGFSSTLNTSAFSEGFKYSPTTSAALVANSGSVLTPSPQPLKINPSRRSTRDTTCTLAPNASATPRTSPMALARRRRLLPATPGPGRGRRRHKSAASPISETTESGLMTPSETRMLTSEKVSILSSLFLGRVMFMGEPDSTETQPPKSVSDWILGRGANDVKRKRLHPLSHSNHANQTT